MEEDGKQTNSPIEVPPLGEQARGGEGTTVEFDLEKRPTGIQAICMVNMAGLPIIRLLVQGMDNRTLMDSSQDLEDTLALGAFIVEATADVLEDVAKLLKDSAWREGIGGDFESYVEKTEAATQRIRKQLSVVERGG